MFAERAHAIAHVRGEIAAGNATWVEHWRDAGGDERAHHDETWLEQERAALVAAIVG